MPIRPGCEGLNHVIFVLLKKESKVFCSWPKGVLVYMLGVGGVGVHSYIHILTDRKNKRDRQKDRQICEKTDNRHIRFVFVCM